MSNVHVCRLTNTIATGLPKLPPNASCCMRLRRMLRTLIIVNPRNFNCLAFFHHKSAIMQEQKRHITGPYHYMIHPFSDLNNFFRIIFFLTWVITMMVDPVFEDMLRIDTYLSKFIDYTIFTIQLTLVCCIFFVGYLDFTTMEVVLDHKLVVKKYLKTYFIFDVIGVELMNTIVRRPEDYHEDWMIRRTLRFLHVLCLYVRLNTLVMYLNDIGRMMNISRKLRKILTYILKTFMYLHLFSSMVYSIPCIVYRNNFPEDSWLAQARIQPNSGASLSKKYWECLLMVVCYFFGASSGKYFVDRTNEQVCLSTIMFIGRIYTLYLLADIMRMFGVAGISESRYERNLAQLKEYMVSNNLPVSLTARMIRYFEVKLDKRYFNEVGILDSLSEQLRIEVFLFSAREVMKKSNVFKHLTQDGILDLIPMMRLVTYAPGDVILKPGQTHEYSFFISSGSVAVSTRDGVELMHLEDGDIFGVNRHHGSVHVMYVVAIETTEVFIVDVQGFFKFLDTYPQAYHYIKALSKKRMSAYKEKEIQTKTHMDTCLIELRKGLLLERKTMRNIARY